MKKVIVLESPNKIKKIQKIVGGDYRILATYGHFRNLSNISHGKMGINLLNYEPDFVVTKPRVVQILQQCQDADIVYLATDPDREGHGIAYHIQQILELEYPRVRRMIFHEITPHAIKQALTEADRDGRINMNEVYSYFSRVMLDKLVGYKVSPLLWKHIQGAKSSGRVQSVAVKLLVEREQEIKEHVYEKYYHVYGIFEENIKGILNETIQHETTLLSFIEDCKESTYKVQNKREEEVKFYPPPPFKTSTLQQCASSLGFSPKYTMKIAQRLYEQGKITYHRTDTTLLSHYFQAIAKKYIEENYGEEYVHLKKAKQSKFQQNAHECIRPTSLDCVQVSGENENNLYQLIWKRTLASCMSPEICMKYSIDIVLSKSTYYFIASYVRTVFPGYTIVYETQRTTENKCVMYMEEREIQYEEIHYEEEYTQPKSRYTESTFVQLLETKGIGRPSTYANILHVIQDRDYIRKEKDKKREFEVIHRTLHKKNLTEKKIKKWYGDNKYKLFVQDLGFQVVSFLNESMSLLMNVDFTKDMEERLDSISHGKESYKSILKEIHQYLLKQLSLYKQTSTTKKKKQYVVYKGEQLEIKHGKYGRYFTYRDKNYSLKNIEATEENIEKIVSQPPKVIQEWSYNYYGDQGKLMILHGKFGYYVCFQGKKRKNFKLPKDLKTLERLQQCKVSDLKSILE